MKNTIILFLLSTLFSCTGNKNQYDATGVFEAEETIISAQATGEIKEFKVLEGAQLKQGELVGYIDTMPLFLRKKQLMAQSKAVLSKAPSINTQLAALEEQLAQAKREQQRVQNLVKADAATQKQLDDVNAQVNILEKQLDASRSSLGITSGGLNEETVPILVQIEQINDQLKKSRLINPLKGTVLVTYTNKHEMAVTGKPLYKIADLSELILRAYLTADQLGKVKTGQRVQVLTATGEEKYNTHNGTILWISDKAEFTPKTIQTKDERANLVYAIKIKVPNDGTLKLGMYAEVKF